MRSLDRAARSVPFTTALLAMVPLATAPVAIVVATSGCTSEASAQPASQAVRTAPREDVHSSPDAPRCALATAEEAEPERACARGARVTALADWLIETGVDEVGLAVDQFVAWSDTSDAMDVRTERWLFVRRGTEIDACIAGRCARVGTGVGLGFVAARTVGLRTSAPGEERVWSLRADASGIRTVATHDVRWTPSDVRPSHTSPAEPSERVLSGVRPTELASPEAWARLGALLESLETDDEFGGDRLVAATLVEHGSQRVTLVQLPDPLRESGAALVLVRDGASARRSELFATTEERVHRVVRDEAPFVVEVDDGLRSIALVGGSVRYAGVTTRVRNEWSYACDEGDDVEDCVHVQLCERPVRVPGARVAPSRRVSVEARRARREAWHLDSEGRVREAPWIEPLDDLELGASCPSEDVPCFDERGFVACTR